MLTAYIIRARPCKHSDVISLKYTDIRGGSLDWISGFQSGFLDFKVDFWISDWISGFQSGFLDFVGFRWISGFQIGFLPTVYEISFVADPSGLSTASRHKLASTSRHHALLTATDTTALY